MSKPANTSQPLTVQPVYLAASAVNTLVCALPAGTAYFIGLVLLPLFTGQLVHHQGSLARAALPSVVQLRWGGHRGERALERGKVSLAALFDRALTWGVEGLPSEPVRVGNERRPVHALDSSTIARLRARLRCALVGKGYGHRAQRAVKANLVAALTTVGWVRGVGGGVVERTRFGTSSAEAVAKIFAALPASQDKRLLSVEAGSATVEQFRAATEQAALLGRLRRNVALRRAPRQPRRGQRGRPPPGTDQACTRGPSGQKGPRPKTGSSGSRRARCEVDGGTPGTLPALTRRSLRWCASMIQPTSVPC